MPRKQHGRQYDLVIYGATGYTGRFIAEAVTKHMPTDLKWAVAGRSRDKLEQLVENLRALDLDRIPPAIETCVLCQDSLTALARRAFALVAAVGPFCLHGEPAFRACTEEGTHYLDITGEVPFVVRMTARYASSARASGALMFPQMGVESAPADLSVWLGAAHGLGGGPVRHAASAIYGTSGGGTELVPSGGTIGSWLGLFESTGAKELAKAFRPFALSPVPNPKPARPPPPPGSGKASALLTKLTGVSVPHKVLGLCTPWIMEAVDRAMVQRTWGLLEEGKIPSAYISASGPSPGDGDGHCSEAKAPSPDGRIRVAYGPNFSFSQYYGAPSWRAGLLARLVVVAASLCMVLLPLRVLARMFVAAPGEGPPPEEQRSGRTEYKTIVTADVDHGRDDQGGGKEALVRAWTEGGCYVLTGRLLTAAVQTLVEEDLELEGGVYSPATLGQPFVDRLEKVGLHFEVKVLS